VNVPFRAWLVAILLAISASMVRPAPRRGVELSDAPVGVAAAAVAFGGLNGIIVDYLWLHAGEQQDEGRYFEMAQTAQWIAALQPRLGSLYDFQAWNMAYNISETFADPADQWRWIEEGVRLLADTGIKRDGDDPLVYQALAALLLDRIADSNAPQADAYRQYWAQRWDHLSRPVPEAANLLEKSLGAPLDWRCAQSHALYYATIGGGCVEGVRGRLLFRYRLQALRSCAEDGRYVPVKRPFSAPRPDLVAATVRLYDTLCDQYPDDPGLRAGQADFRREAVLLLTGFGQERQARQIAGAAYDTELHAAAADLVTGDADLARGVILSYLIRAELSHGLPDEALSAGLTKLARLGYDARPPGLSDSFESLQAAAHAKAIAP
jgi:hypothetical protein